MCHKDAIPSKPFNCSSHRFVFKTNLTSPTLRLSFRRAVRLHSVAVPITSSYYTANIRASFGDSAQRAAKKILGKSFPTVSLGLRHAHLYSREHNFGRTHYALHANMGRLALNKRKVF